MNMDYKQLGKRIQQQRLKKGLKQDQLAEKVNFGNNHISHIENGSTKLSLEALVNICNALDVTPDFVLLDSIYRSKEYIKDEIAALLKDCPEKKIRLIANLIKAALESPDE